MRQGFGGSRALLGVRMSVVSLPVTRPAGRMLIIANPAMQSQPVQTLQQLGLERNHVAALIFRAKLELRRKLAHRSK